MRICLVFNSLFLAFFVSEFFQVFNHKVAYLFYHPTDIIAKSLLFQLVWKLFWKFWNYSSLFALRTDQRVNVVCGVG